MLRRAFFGGAVATIAAAVGVRAGNSRPGDDLRVERFDSNGRPRCRIYAQRDGVFAEVHPNEVRSGDKVILIDVDGGRLRRLDVATVKETCWDDAKSYSSGFHCEGEVVEVLKQHG